MSFLDRLRRLMGRPTLIVPDDLFATDESSSAAPVGGAKADETAAAEQALSALVSRLAGGEQAAVAELERGAPLERVEALIAAGHGRLAAEWLDKLAVAAPAGGARERLRARAADLYLARGEAKAALPHLEALVTSPEHGARAHFLLAEHHGRQGDRRRALRHYEAVLARDLHYPNARARALALRAALGGTPRPAAAAAAATFAGVDGQAVIAGSRYRLLAEIGRGATGAVYRARDVELEREVAVKLLHAHLGGRGTLARFFVEARVAAALRHPGIVAILDLDEEHRRIVMELLTGGTLRERLLSGPLAPGEALRRHVEILAALAAAHRHGVVHRDLKPANLLFRRDPARPTEIVLCDFGAAYLQKGDEPHTREAVGTLRYMAPEQRRGETTPVADVYAAGVILYETLTGRAALGLADRPPAEGLALPKTLARALPAQVGEHIATLTRADPAARPASAKALAAARRLVEIDA